MSAIPILAGEEARRWVEAKSRSEDSPELDATVRQIIQQVREGGDDTLLALAERFDGRRPAALRVPPERCREAFDALNPERRKAFETARRNLVRFHSVQVTREEPVDVMPGVRAWREFRPIDRVGIYAPGGRAAYPSSVLMAVVPARIAGVREVVVCCPAGPSGEPPDAVLAACGLLEVDAVYAVGGAQAIAAMALGTETIQRVDKVFGPGGAWVNAAKLALFSKVAIDLPAGPSEVTVWADSVSSPDWVAAELVAQAEHGPDSVVVAVLSDDSGTGLEELARAVADASAVKASELDGLPGQAARASLARGAVLVATSDEEAGRWVNELAPEHLSIMRRDADDQVGMIRHAGSVFVGGFSPVAAGDYCSGTNHVLPTGGRVRGTSGLSVADFGRWMQVQRINRSGLESLAPVIETLAEWEGLPAHAASVRARFETDEPSGWSRP
jgi:histidinol dehydrogenase